MVVPSAIRQCLQASQDDSRTSVDRNSRMKQRQRLELSGIATKAYQAHGLHCQQSRRREMSDPPIMVTKRPRQEKRKGVCERVSWCQD
jgi:hypothetical protein